MKFIYLLFLFSWTLQAQPIRRIQVIPNPQSAEDFDHLNKGCPENSECDPTMGQMMVSWKTLVQKAQALPKEKRAQFLEQHRSSHGIPTEFYTTEKSLQGFRPILHASTCKEHNPKDPAQKILRGTAFVKSITTDKAIIVRDKTVIELPLKEMFWAQPVDAFYPEKTVTYHLSLGDQPLFIRKKDLYILKEEDGFYYVLRISPDGDWKIEDLDLSRLSEWEDKKQSVSCPTSSPSPVFHADFCKEVWDEETKKTVIVRMRQGC